MPHEREGPWRVEAAALVAIDQHFYDWILWLASKRLRDQHDLVATELAKLHSHLLAPMGASDAEVTIGHAIAAYERARAGQEPRLGTTVLRVLGLQVKAALASVGSSVL